METSGSGGGSRAPGNGGAGRESAMREPAMREPAETGRLLMRTARQASLATAQRDAEAWPYPSLVMVATDPAGRPLLLISNLADHTRNLAADPRAGLLFDGTGGLAEPLTGPRLSVLGRLAPVEGEEGLLERYLACHPAAAAYAGFGDFRLWRMEPERAHLVAGFGRIHWVPGDRLLLPGAARADLDAAAAEVVRHMNGDHADAVALYATVLLGRPAGDWRMAAIDADGCDLVSGTASARLPFTRPAATPEAARAELVRLVREARAAQA